MNELLLSLGAAKTSSSLMLSGLTDSKISLPGLPSVSFDPFSLNASLALQPSISLDFFELDGSGSISGIGTFNASFSYRGGSTALSLELKPNLPSPFEPNTTVITLVYTNEGGAKLEGVLRAAINLKGSSKPVEIESKITFITGGFSIVGKTVGAITIPGLSCLAIGDMKLNTDMQVCFLVNKLVDLVSMIAAWGMRYIFLCKHACAKLCTLQIFINICPSIHLLIVSYTLYTGTHIQLLKQVLVLCL